MSRTRELKDGIFVIDLGYRESVPVALIEKKYEKYENQYIIVFNYEIEDDYMKWGYGYYYGTDIGKAKNDFEEILKGNDIADTFKQKGFIDDEEKMKDFYNLSKTDFLKMYSYLTEQEYEDTKREVERNANNHISYVEYMIIQEKPIVALPIRYFENDKWGEKNNLLYLAEKYNIEIPDREKEYIRKSLVAHFIRENAYSAINEDKSINVKPYINQIIEKVREKYRLQKKKNKDRGR